MRTTLKDVAERSELSVQTVSRILNGHGAQYQEATRERVQQIADTLGYRANSSAKAMRSGRFGNIALLLSEYFPLSLLPVLLREGIQDILKENDLNLILARFADEDLTSRERTPRILRELMADGLLINYNTDLPQPMKELVTQYKIPAVWINSRHAADCVYPDDFDAGRRAAERLLALGHRRIAFVYSTETRHYSFTDRLSGYGRAMQEAGLTPRQMLVPIDLSSKETILRATAFMDGEDKQTGFVIYTDDPVVMLLTGALLRSRSIPEETAFIAFHDVALSRQGLPVDTMLLPEREVGCAATRMLLEKIAQPDSLREPLALPLTLVPGAYRRPY